MAGKIQNEDIKSVAELTGAGGSANQLPNDDKVWVTANGISKTLYQAIVDGDLSGGGLYVVTSTQTITSGGTITSTVDPRQILYVKGGTGGNLSSTTPLGNVDNWDDGTEILLIGRDDTDYLEIPYNDANYGFIGNFDSIVLTKNKGIKAIWDETNLRFIAYPL